MAGFSGEEIGETASGIIPALVQTRHGEHQEALP